MLFSNHNQKNNRKLNTTVFRLPFAIISFRILPNRFSSLDRVWVAYFVIVRESVVGSHRGVEPSHQIQAPATSDCEALYQEFSPPSVLLASGRPWNQGVVYRLGTVAHERVQKELGTRRDNEALCLAKFLLSDAVVFPFQSTGNFLFFSELLQSHPIFLSLHIRNGSSICSAQSIMFPKRYKK